MQLRYMLVIGLLCGSGAAAQLNQTKLEQGLPMIVQIDEFAQPELSYVEIRGTKNTGEDLVFIAYREQKNEGVTLSAYEDRKSIGFITLSEDKYPMIDLSTIRASYDEDSTDLKVRIQYGLRRVCFSNYDGRDIISVLFKNNAAPQIRTLSYENCERTAVHKGHIQNSL